MRCLENKLTRRFLAMERAGASAKELEELGVGKVELGVIEGDVENGSLLAGQIAGLIKDIKPARAIVEDIMAEAEAAIASLGRLCQGQAGG